MTSNLIRQTFLDFFKEKNHQIIESAPLVIHNDPSLLFTNAGMNQFKDIFLGSREPGYLRVSDTQKCLRVSGKHNDLEEVGIDTYHHTFFEMLGNWSFGDYFKEEAISLAWELLTGIYKLPIADLYVTVFEGNKEDQLELDQEALESWSKWISPDKILMGNKKDNFWEMGITGPCGPCSEIHIDLRSESEKRKTPGKELVNQGHPQVVEIWNLVFIQFNRLANGKLEPLPQKHVDTGMGFERLCMAIQKKESNYDTDVFQPLIQKIANEAGFEYGKEEKIDIALRVISDHIRAITFTLSDGQLPSNTGAGYVIRRILRRAVRYGYTYLNFRKPFLSGLVSVLCDQFMHIFPNLFEQKGFIEKVIYEEESGFLKTLEAGINRFEKYEASKNKVDGKFAFELFDTFGFPIDLTVLMAKEKNWSVDLEVFDKELEAQRLRARTAGSSKLGDWQLPQTNKNPKDSLISEIHSVFMGYDHLDSVSKVVRFREVQIKGENYFQWVMDRTPFYPEGGGQLGDTGKMVFGQEELEIIDTRKENNQILHFTNKLPQHILSINDEIKLVVDPQRRKSISRNHTATHLLQAALKKVLGNHIAQKGSLVEEAYLRFDFSHFSKLTDQEISDIEYLVNEKIIENICLDERRNIPFSSAIEMGSTALFGEKYGDSVRMITFDPGFSRELCGGTHVLATGELGIFEIESETAVGSGIRRITAKTGHGARLLNLKRKEEIRKIESLVKPGGELIHALENLLEENQRFKKEREKNQVAHLKSLKTEYQAWIQNELDKNSKPPIILNRIIKNISSEVLKTIVFELLNEFQEIPLGLIFGLELDTKPFIAVGLSQEYLKTHGPNASSIVKKIASGIEGGGGGQPNYATAGGKNIEGLEKTLAEGVQLIKDQSN